MTFRFCCAWLLLWLAAFLDITGARADPIASVPQTSAQALRDRDPVVHDYFARSVELVFHEKHEACLALLDRFQRSHPDHPAPDFLTAACYQSYMNTYRTNRFTTVMDRHVDAAITKGLALLETVDDPWLHLYIGASFGFRALNRFRRHAWIDALLNIGKSIDHLQAALAKAPNLYDAYMGIGVYNYWRTARSNFIRTVAFWMSDRREIGLQQLRFVVSNGVYAVQETSYNLIAAYIDAGRFQDALELVDRNIARKGASKIIDRYYRGRILMALGQWPEAETTYKALLRKLNRSPLAVDGYKADIGYRVALSLYRQDRYAEARRFTSAALDRCAQRRPEQEIESSFESFRDVRRQLERLHRQLADDLAAETGDTATADLVGQPS